MGMAGQLDWRVVELAGHLPEPSVHGFGANIQLEGFGVIAASLPLPLFRPDWKRALAFLCAIAL
jgi:hypothetical protein